MYILTGCNGITIISRILHYGIGTTLQSAGGFKIKIVNSYNF